MASRNAKDFPQSDISLRSENSSFVKASVDGLNGSGKSQLLARLAIGISKTYCNSAPVLVADSEERWRVYKRTMFEPEGVELVRMSGASLLGVEQAINSMERYGACVFLADQLTTPWKEAVKEFGFEDGYLSFERRQQLMNLWIPFVQQFRYGKFHAICAGRIGYVWEMLEDERGRMRLTQGDSKFNAGGSENFGYEADLELEMSRNKRRLKGLFRAKSSTEYICNVVKDATAGILNGQEFVFDGQVGLYKPGDYRATFNPFRQYIDFMREIDAPVASSVSTRQALISGKTQWAQDQSERKGLLEDIDKNLDFCFPGGEGRSNMAKMFRNLTLEHLNGFMSWVRMEEEVSTGQLRDNLAFIKKLRSRIERKQIPVGQESLMGLWLGAHEDIVSPEKNRSLEEILGEHSGLIKCSSKVGPQPVVEDAIGRKYNVAR